MGNNIRLVVKISEKVADREKRLAQKLEEEEFLNTLNCAKYEVKGKEEHGREVEEFELNDDEAERSSQNPLYPHYIPVSANHTSRLSSSAGLSSLASHGGAGASASEAGSQNDKGSKSVSVCDIYI